MADLIPTAELRLAYESDAFGLMTYTGDDVSWTLVDVLGTGFTGTNQSTYTGLVPDPTGQCVIQQPVIAWRDADETQWTTANSTSTNSGGATVQDAVWGHGINPATGKKFLTQQGGPSTLSTTASTFTALHNYTRPADEGVALTIYRPAVAIGAGQTPPTGTSWALYVELNVGRGRYDDNSPRPGYRLAIESGNPIRLEGTLDDETWTTLDVASALGDVDTYLKTRGRKLTIEVYPLSDLSWYTGLPQSANVSDAPADTLAVRIGGGDAVLSYSYLALDFPAGQLRISGTGGQFSCEYGDMRYVVAALAYLPEQVRFRPLRSQATSRIYGYAPYGDWGGVEWELTDVNKVDAELAIAVPEDNWDPTCNLARRTVQLSSVVLTFPPIWSGPQSVTRYTSYTPVRTEEDSWFDQGSFTRRSKARVVLPDQSGALAPGRIIPAVRAATLVRGYVTADGAYDDRRAGITGLSALDPQMGISWFLGEDGRRYFEISLDDRLRRSDPDLVKSGFRAPFDGECHYYVMRQLAYLLGITDEFLDFPFCERGSACPHYHLPRGTNRDPLFGPQPGEPVGAVMARVRSYAGEIDPSGAVNPLTGDPLILPMVLYVNEDGRLQYYPLPAGVARTFLDPSLNIYVEGIEPVKTFGHVPTFTGESPNLDEITQGSDLRSMATLTNIRSSIVAIGRQPTDGSLVYAYEYDPTLGSGGDPDAFGSVGIDMPLYQISRYYTSPEAAWLSVQALAVQSSFPAVRTRFAAHMQSNLPPLSVMAVQDYGTQGNTQPVSYYVTRNQIVITDDGMRRDARSIISCRLLGQAD